MINYPEKLLKRYREMLSPDDFSSFMESLEKPLKKSLRYNRLRMTRDEFLEYAQKAQWELSPIPLVEDGFFIDREDKEIPLGNTIPHISGLIYLQEASSMLSSQLLAPKEHELVLDMAASPGSKTTHMAMMMRNTGFILANDLSSKRIKGLISNLQRLSIANTAVVRKNAIIFGNICPNTFDKVLLDAPCTGEGLIRKDRTVFEKWSEMNIKIMSGIQKKLIESAFRSLKTNGEMIYSTCTLAPEENEEVIDYLHKRYGNIMEVVDMRKEFLNAGISEEILKKSSGISAFGNRKYTKEVEKSLRIWPHNFDTEGFFLCKIRKLKKVGEGSYANKKVVKQNIKKTLKFLQRKEIKSIESFIKKHFGYPLEIEKHFEVIKLHHDVYIRSRSSERFYEVVHFEYNGLPIVKDIRDSYVISHEAVMLWGRHFTKQIIDLDEQQKNDYLKGKDISFSDSSLEEGSVVLRYNGIVLGKGLLRGEKVKNQLPREYVLQ